MGMLRNLLIAVLLCSMVHTSRAQLLRGNALVLYPKAGLSDTLLIKAPTLSAPWTLTLPTTAGTSNYFLQTNGSGVTTWASATSSGMTNPMTTEGDIIYENSFLVPARLGIGTTWQTLGQSSGDPTWLSSADFGYSTNETMWDAGGTFNDANIPPEGLFIGTTAPSANVTFTGFYQSGYAQRITFVDNGAYTVTFDNQNAGSAAANRFDIGSNLTLHPGETAMFWYDNSFANRWKLIATSNAIYYGGGTVTSFSATGLAALFTTGVTTATTTPALSFSPVSVTDHQFYAGIIGGGSAAPAFRAIALSDLPSGTGTVTSVATDATLTGGTITTTGTLGIALSHANTWSGIQGFPSVLLNGASPVTNAGLTIKNSHLQSQQTIVPSAATQPTGCGIAGAGGTAAVATLTHATDVAGTIAVSTTDGALFPGGVNPAAGNIVAVTYNAAYTTTPMVELTAADATTALIHGYLFATATGSFTIGVASIPPGATATTYKWIYHVIETQ
jgi:hypothetical protein